MTKKVTTEDFIRRAKQKHGNRYDYSLVNYTKAKEYVTIICSTHGEFPQTPGNHLQGKGCLKCRNQTKSQEKFIKQAKEKHGDHYSYKNVIYKGIESHVSITCNICNEDFTQKPTRHLQGRGCGTCGIKKSRSSHIKSQEKFIKQAKEKHGNKYDYSLVNYTKDKEHITIICSTHGEFSQAPGNHLQSQGCSKCAHTVLGFSRRLTLDEFLERSKKIHGDKYDYSKVVYVNNCTPVSIICKHGEFTQNPNKHLQGNGCRKCTNLEKYGIEFILQDPDKLYNQQKKSFTFKEYITPSDKKWLLQGYEPILAGRLIQLYGEENVLHKRKDMPEIWYVDEENNKHRYFGDFYIKSINTVFEVKSTWTENLHLENVNKKIIATVKNGNNCQLIVYNRKKMVKNELYMCKGPIHFISYSIKD